MRLGGWRGWGGWLVGGCLLVRGVGVSRRALLVGLLMPWFFGLVGMVEIWRGIQRATVVFMKVELGASLEIEMGVASNLVGRGSIF